MKTLKEKIEVMQAALDEKEIEVLRYDSDIWIICYKPSFNWDINDYRIKPEPLEGWFNIYKDKAIGLYETKEEAEEGAHNVIIKTLKMRQVTDE